MTDSIAAQVAALPKTPTAELKQKGRELYGQEPPGSSRSYLVSRLAYRIQELAYGGAEALDPDQAGCVGRRARSKGSAAAGCRPAAGTQLIREWRGAEHTVTVLPDGCEWEGRRYRSLSQMVRNITDTRWNGPAFFRLRSGNR